LRAQAERRRKTEILKNKSNMLWFAEPVFSFGVFPVTLITVITFISQYSGEKLSRFAILIDKKSKFDNIFLLNDL